MNGAAGTLAAATAQRAPRYRRLLSADGALTAAAMLAVVAWGAVTFTGALGWWARAGVALNWLLVAGPLVALLLVLFSRPHSPRGFKWALVSTVLLAGSIEAVRLIGSQWVYGYLPLVLALAGVVATRWPVPTVAIAFALSGTPNLMQAFVAPPGPIADFFLVGAWLGLLWAFLTGRKEPPRAVPWALVLLGIYLAVTMFMTLVGEELYPSLWSFRQSAWYMAAVFMVILFLPRRDQQQALQRAVLLVGAFVGGYAMLRWAIGPAAKEEALAVRGGPFVTEHGSKLGDPNAEIRLFGSMAGPQSLGYWCALMVAFALPTVLTPMKRIWRSIALFDVLTCGAALVGADTRAPMVSVVAGIGVVLVLFTLSRSFSPRTVMPLALCALLLIAGGGVFAVNKIAGDDVSAERFRNIVTPLQDRSVQERLIKWNELLKDIEDRPFGRGMGASGAAEQKFARFSSPATHGPDSTYLKVAYDQGLFVMILFIFAIVTITVSLARLALTARDPFNAALALGACGAAVVLGVQMNANIVFEGLGALQPWVLIGLGFAPFVAARPPRPAWFQGHTVRETRGSEDASEVSVVLRAERGR